MKPFIRRVRINSLRNQMLAGVAALACSAGMAHAQEASDPSTPINLEAEELVRAGDGVIIASGDVEGRYEDRTLTADRLSYDPNNRLITAEGDVLIVDQQGNAQSARSIMLDQDLEAGVAFGFAAREGAAKFAAASAIRHSEMLNELNRAIFTPCDICNQQGEAKQPTWSVGAERIIQDRERKLVYYRNAVFRVKGAPVFWAPVFWHADPQAERVSGLLAPRFTSNRRRGVSYEQPILWAISPYQDLVVTPQINARVNPFIDAEWRKRFYSGTVNARIGYTHEQDFNTAGRKFGEARDKAYVLAHGAFEPSESWDWGFSAERVQDKLLFDQYSIRDIYEPRGIFLSDDRRLLSQLYAVRQDERSYLSFATMAFQSLRPLLTQPPNAFGIRPFEDDDTLPLVAPLIEGRWEPKAQILGGRLRVRGGGVSLRREESPFVTGAPGVDSARATLELDWRAAITLASGLRIEPFADLRGDYYSITDATAQTQTVSRGLGTVGVDLSMPFIRNFGAATVVVEPIVQVALSPDAKAYPEIPNEDSIAFDFNDTNLFEPNRSPGFDLFEGGQRLNVGVRASVDWGEGRNAQAVLGRSLRADPDPVFAARTGLQGRSSDWIFAAEATPIAGFSFYAKTRLNDESLDVRRVEFGADVALARGQGYVRYLREDQDFAGVPREDIEAAGDLFVTRNWGVTFDAIHDLEQDTWRRRAVGIVYRDECTRFDLVYQRHDDPVLGGRSTSSIGFSLKLAINGEPGYRNETRRWTD